MLRDRLKLGLPVLVVLGALLIALLMVRARPALPRSEVSVPLPQVQIQEVQKSNVAVMIRAQGTVRSRQQLDLDSEVAGRIEWIAPEFLAGERVSEGSVLARVDPTDYRVALADARVALASAEMALADATALKRRAAAAEASARVEAARERIRQAEQDLAHTEIRAPFNALIDTRSVELGQYLTPGKNLARLLGTDLAEIRLPVTAVDAGFLDTRSKEPVVLQAQRGAQLLSWSAKLARVEQRVDDQTRVFPVVVEVDHPYDSTRHPAALSLGLFVEASLPGTPVPNAVALPRTALHGGDYVFTLKDGYLHRRAVSVLRLDEGQVIIGSGLENGDLVVLTRLDLMFEGMPVMRADD